MTRKLAIAVVLSGGILLADFSYQQTSKVTGGMMAGMMKTFSKQAREPMRSTVMVKGDRMVMLHGEENAQIIDLAKETMTEINFKNKTYATVTFAEMKQAVEKAAAKMREKQREQEAKTGEKAELTFKVDVKETGKTQEINGMNARNMLMTLDVIGKDKQSGQAGAMSVAIDMWMAPAVAGYEEVKSFHQRMAQKMAFTPGMLNAMAQTQPGMSESMSEAARQMSKLDGIPVLQVTRMGSSVDGQTMAASSPSSAPPDGQQAPHLPPAQQAAGQAAGDAAAGAAEGRMGRFGGLAGAMRRKQQEQQQASARQQTQTQPAQQGSSGVLLELTTELAGFSSAPVDASRLEVPAGYKQVEHEMVKSLR